MTVVAFPYVEQTFKTAMSEVLNPYLTTGATTTAGGVIMDFDECEVHYNIDAVKLPSTLPRVCITGSRSNSLGDLKCTNNKNSNPLGYVTRLAIYRSVYVAAPKSLYLNTRPITWEDMDRIWSQVHAVISTKLREFIDRNIYRPTLSAVPVPQHEDEFYILYGAFSCEVRFDVARG